jgi:ElaA protein
MTLLIKPYPELSLDDFHDLVALRIAVFVIEQNCPYQDLDGKDKKAFHLIIRDIKTNEMIGTARILPAGVSYEEVSIGRVASHPEFRNRKIGHVMMKAAMQFVKDELNNASIRISAQSHLCNFYAQYGFKSTGKEYLEDDIPHTEMLYKSL